VEYLDISKTDGPRWKASLSSHPSVIVAIDVNVHAKLDWWEGWPRAVGICQWTLSGAPYHPIYLDAVRRVINSTRVVEAWEEERQAMIDRLEDDRPEDWEMEVAMLRAQGRSTAMEVMEWTGPGLFSDAVIG
jgi:alpha 1,6-mannosyltransferase